MWSHFLEIIFFDFLIIIFPWVPPFDDKLKKNAKIFFFLKLVQKVKKSSFNHILERKKILPKKNFLGKIFDFGENKLFFSKVVLKVEKLM